jgi:hypothetical protein
VIPVMRFSLNTENVWVVCQLWSTCASFNGNVKLKPLSYIALLPMLFWLWSFYFCSDINLGCRNFFFPQWSPQSILTASTCHCKCFKMPLEVKETNSITNRFSIFLYFCINSKKKNKNKAKKWSRNRPLKWIFAKKLMRNYLRKLFCEVWPTKVSSVFLMIQSCNKSSFKVQHSSQSQKQNASPRSEEMEILL